MMICLCVFVCLCMCTYACRLRSALGIPQPCSAFYFERSLAEPGAPPAQLDQQASKRCENPPVCLLALGLWTPPTVPCFLLWGCGPKLSSACFRPGTLLAELSLQPWDLMCGFLSFAIRNCSFGTRGGIIVYIPFFRSSKWGS